MTSRAINSSHFGPTLTAVLDSLNLTQYQLGTLLNAHGHPYNHSLVSRWVHSQRNPSRPAVTAITNTLQDRLEPITNETRAVLFATAGYWPDHWPIPPLGPQ